MDAPPSARVRPWWIGPGAVVLLAVVVRLLFIVRVDGGLALTEAELEHDNVSYFELAARISDGDLMSWSYPGPGPQQGEVVPTAFRPPLWPMVQAIPYVVTGPSPTVGRLWNVLLASGACGLVVVLGRRLHSPLVGLMAGVGSAVWPQFVEASRQLMTEGLLLLVVVGTLLALDLHLQRPSWRTAGVVGLLLGLLGLVRANGLGVAVVLAAWLLWRARRQLIPAVRQVTVMAVAAIAVVAPYVAYQTSRFGTPVGISTQSGTVLAGDFNDNVADLSFDRWGWWDIGPSLEVLHRVEDEIEWDRQSRQVGVDWITDNPVTSMRIVGLRAVRYTDAYWDMERRIDTGLVGSSRLLNVLTPLLWWPTAILAAVAAWRIRRTPGAAVRWTPIALLFGTFALFGVLLGGASRYRLPAEPGVILLASTVAVGWLPARLRSPHRARSLAPQPQGDSS